VEVECAFAGNPVDGFDPATFGLTTPDGLVEVVGPLPDGSECTVTETDDNGAAAVEIDPPQPVIINAGGTAVQVIVTNTFLTGELVVTKVVDGPGAALLPDGTVFTVEVACTYLGAPVNGFDPRVLDLTTPDDLSATLGPVPVGAECTVTETENQNADETVIDPADPVIILRRDEGPVDVTVTNTFAAGLVTVEKVVDGPGAGFVPDGTVFTVEVDCVFAGNPVVGFDPLVVDLVTPDQLSGSVGPLPAGAECTVSETEDQGAVDVVVDPADPVVVEGSLQEPFPEVGVTVTNTFGTGELTVSKVLAGAGGALLPDGTVFTVEVACSYLGAPVAGFDPLVVDLVTPDQLSGSVGPLPAGAECTVSETEDQGAAEVEVAPVQPVTIGAGGTATEVTVTNTFETGQFSVEKVLSGSGAAFVPAGWRSSAPLRGTRWTGSTRRRSG